jgi:hypothetical protein
VPQLFPSLAESAGVRSRDATTLIRIVLRGARSVATKKEPTAPGMPSFDGTKPYSPRLLRASSRFEASRCR